MNKNIYLINNFTTYSSLFNFLMVKLQTSTSLWQGVITCQAVTFSHCKTYTVFDNCTACLAGYYLKEG